MRKKKRFKKERTRFFYYTKMYLKGTDSDITYVYIHPFAPKELIIYIFFYRMKDTSVN